MEFWEWDVCMVFKNPDAQSSAKKMKTEKALSMIMGMFKAMERKDELEKKKYRQVEHKVVKSILEGMEDENGKVRKY